MNVKKPIKLALISGIVLATSFGTISIVNGINGGQSAKKEPEKVAAPTVNVLPIDEPQTATPAAAGAGDETATPEVATPQAGAAASSNSPAVANTPAPAAPAQPTAGSQNIQVVITDPPVPATSSPTPVDVPATITVNGFDK